MNLCTILVLLINNLSVQQRVIRFSQGIDCVLYNRQVLRLFCDHNVKLSTYHTLELCLPNIKQWKHNYRFIYFSPSKISEKKSELKAIGFHSQHISNLVYLADQSIDMETREFVYKYLSLSFTIQWGMHGEATLFLKPHKIQYTN